MQIAQSGYALFHCPAGTTYPPSAWCGNTGWFPGYSLLLAPFYAMGTPPILTGLLVAWLFDLATLILLWVGFLDGIRGQSKYAALIFAAFVPGGIYMRVVFPMSTAVFFIMVSFLLLRWHRHWWAAAAAGFAAASYPTASAMIPVIALGVFLDTEQRCLGRRLALSIGCAALASLGPLAMVIAQQIDTGHWNGYLLVQAHYNGGLHSPAVYFGILMKWAVEGPLALNRAIGLEAVLGALTCISLLAYLAIRICRRDLSHEDVLVVLLLMLCWIYPLTRRGESVWRGDTLLFPAALLIARFPTPVATLLCCAAVAMFPVLAVYFFNGSLV